MRTVSINRSSLITNFRNCEENGASEGLSDRVGTLEDDKHCILGCFFKPLKKFSLSLLHERQFLTDSTQM